MRMTYYVVVLMLKMARTGSLLVELISNHSLYFRRWRLDRVELVSELASNSVEVSL